MLQRSFRAARRKNEQRKRAMAEHARNQTDRSKAAISLQTFFRGSLGRAYARARRAQRQADCLCAIRAGSVEWCRELIERKGVSIKFCDKDGATALHHAAAAKRDSVVEELLRLGADVNATDNNGRTPLHMACIRRAPEAARRLALSGADVEAPDKWAHTPCSKPALFLLPILDQALSHSLTLRGARNL
ncbi:ankyrin repeat-containing domain protein [Baffinella frigidus]|nr:ankyrin repeat-containing domain protein [Cryptophyta sp. CCMP2293]